MHLRLTLLLLVITSSAWSAQPTQTTKNYYIALQQVYGAIMGVKNMKEICGDSFPEYIQTNDAAYKKWASRYRPFISEMEKHWTDWVWEEVKHDSQQRVALLSKIDSGIKRGIRSTITSEGPETFRGICKTYPLYLADKQNDKEHFYRAQVQTIRQGKKQ